MKKNFFSALSVLAVWFATSLPASAQNAATADFSQGVGTTHASTQFVGDPGDGWETAWATASTGASMSTDVINTDPIKGKENYLKVDIDAEGAGDNRTGLNRRFNNGLAESRHTIAFSIRFDSLTGFDEGDFIGIFATNNPIPTSTSTNGQTWGILISGSNEVISLRAAESGKGQTVNTGITVTPGVTCHFTLKVDPENQTWEASITTSDSKKFTSPPMGFRVDATVGRTFNLNTLANSEDDDWSYSFSGLKVTPES